MTPRPTFALRRLNAALLMTLAGTAGAQTLQEVVVSASRQEQQSFDAPASVQADPEVIRAYLGGGDVGALRRRLRAQPA